MPFQVLTNLFANADNAIESLNSIRLNPNFVSQNKLRNDLEFYIPQLCTFLLFGEVKAIEEFFVFLCKVCNASFFFAHRVYWFLTAMINSAQEKKDDILDIVKMINTLFKSESKKKKEKIEKFYIANSKEYMDYIRDNDLYFLYNPNTIDENKNVFQNIDFNSLNMIQQLTYNKYKENREKIVEFCNNEYDKVKYKEGKKLKKNGKLNNLRPSLLSEVTKDGTEDFIEEDIDTNNDIDDKKKLEPNDFFIDISNFKLNNRTIDIDDLLEVNEIDDDNGRASQEFLYGNKDNDNFVNLEKTAKDINYISYYSTLNFIEHLCDISNDLPKHPIDEQMLFLYKKLNQINKKLPCNVYLPFLKDSARNYIICHIPLDGVKIFRTKTRCPIMLTFEMVRIEEINNEIKKTSEFNVENQGSKSIGSLDLSFNKSNSKKNKKLKLLNDMILPNTEDYKNADYDLSKPLLIDSEVEIANKKNKIVQHKKETDKDDEKYLKIVSKFRARNTVAFPTKSHSNLLFTKTVPSKENKSNKKEDKLMQKVNNIEEIFEEKEEESSSIDEDKQTVEKSLNFEDFKNIFGETFEQKQENLKKSSLFGKFKTYKLFRCIFKTHEDLRQEQFATQLINEFNQIFRLEKVDCWLNTYEIISTGNDSGLVEMVNNSLSLDQLKQKLNNIPLRDFYLYYFGKGHPDSKEYKKAMNNYVSSLAGYSLVCYFLQIKDRHNGNILIDNQGYLTHIDFGFMLSNAPGKGIKFEKAPFKLSKDMLQCLGGSGGKYFEKFRNLLKEGFMAIFKHRQKIIILVEMMWCGNGRNLECFEKGQEAIDELKLRLQPKGCKKKSDAYKYVDKLIEQSVDNWRTKWYDIFQYYVQGIFY